MWIFSVGVVGILGFLVLGFRFLKRVFLRLGGKSRGCSEAFCKLSRVEICGPQFIRRNSFEPFTNRIFNGRGASFDADDIEGVRAKFWARPEDLVFRVYAPESAPSGTVLAYACTSPGAPDQIAVTYIYIAEEIFKWSPSVMIQREVWSFSILEDIAVLKVRDREVMYKLCLKFKVLDEAILPKSHAMMSRITFCGLSNAVYQKLIDGVEHA